MIGLFCLFVRPIAVIEPGNSTFVETSFLFDKGITFVGLPCPFTRFHDPAREVSFIDDRSSRVPEGPTGPSRSTHGLVTIWSTVGTAGSSQFETTVDGPDVG